MPLVTIRPDATFQVGGGIYSPLNFTAVGGASIDAVLRDDSDATYVDISSVGLSGDGDFPCFIVGFSDFALPAGAVAYLVYHRMRCFAGPISGDPAFGHLVYVYTEFASATDGMPAAMLVTPNLENTTPTTYTSTPSQDPYGATPGNGWYVGGPWVQQDLDAIAVAVRAYFDVDFFHPTLRIEEMYVDIVYVDAPTITLSAPSGTITAESNPLIAWTYNRPPDAPSSQIYYRARVFSAAQYGIGGFDPETSPSTWDSGVVSSGASSVRPPILTNGTYRAYVKAAGVTNSRTQWSSWQFSDFVLAAPGPGAPDISIVCQDALGRVQINVGMGAAPDWQFVEVQRSADGGVTWTDMRASTVVAPGVPPGPPSPPTGGDDLYEPDNPQAWVDAFGPVSAFDQEFQRTTSPTAPPTNWVFQNQNSAAYIETMGQGVVSIPVGSNSDDDVCCLVQPVPSQVAYAAAGKARTFYNATEYVGFGTGLIITDGTKGVGIYWTFTDDINVKTWDDIAGTGNTVVDTLASMPSPSYWRIVKNSATDYDFAFSYDGLLWETLTAGYDVSAFLTPTHIGFLFNQGNGINRFTADWFRVRP